MQNCRRWQPGLSGLGCLTIDPTRPYIENGRRTSLVVAWQISSVGAPQEHSVQASDDRVENDAEFVKFRSPRSSTSCAAVSYSELVLVSDPSLFILKPQRHSGSNSILVFECWPLCGTGLNVDAFHGCEHCKISRESVLPILALPFLLCRQKLIRILAVGGNRCLAKTTTKLTAHIGEKGLTFAKHRNTLTDDCHVNADL